MKLTILVPFVGALILFNAQLVELLKMTPMSFFGEANGEPAIPVWRLAATYFGLVSLGCASFLFALRCPPDLKGATDLTDFAAREAQLTTTARASYLAMSVLENFRRYRLPFDDTTTDAFRSWRPAYPEEHERTFYLFSNRVSGSIFDREPREGNYDSDIFDMKGDVQVDEFANRFVMPSGAGRNLPVFLGDAAMEAPMELYTLRYTDLDHSQPYDRTAIAALYILGFGLLAIPSIVTVLAVVRYLLGI